MKYPYSMGGGLAEYGTGTNGQADLNDSWSKFYYRRPSNESNGNPDQLGEQNRGPRTNKSKNKFIVKAYSTRAGDCNAEGNIVISADQYNKDDFSVDCPAAKFFVIKSYSEDDVHKSIKYNVWSSTPNGNKKLSTAYEDAQKIAAGKPRGCPVFLFFSVSVVVIMVKLNCEFLNLRQKIYVSLLVCCTYLLLISAGQCKWTVLWCCRDDWSSRF